MNIALIGYGNMGKEIERLVATSPEHQIVSVSGTHDASLDKEGIKRSDVVIEFTSPEVALDNIREVLSLRVPLVVGTTGWYDHLSDVKRLAEETHTGLIYGQNFSIGANIFFQLVRVASQLTSIYQEYDVFGVETHHVGKKDSPSGTAKKLGEIIVENSTDKKVVQNEKLERQIRSDELHFASVRGGRNFGKHEIVFDSVADEIHLTHQAWSREGFAQGTLIAAEFIHTNKGFYEFEDLFMKGTIKR